MLKAFILSLALVTVGQAALAETVRLTEQSGRWVCQSNLRAGRRYGSI